jgi:hypothetical protein
MTSRPLALIIALGALTACGSHDAPEKAADSAIAAATAVKPVEKTPHVRAIDLGRAIDSTQRITGGVLTSFHPGDTIFVSVRTEFVKEGAGVDLRLTRGKTRADSTSVKLGAPNAEGLAVVSARFMAPGKGWPVGTYSLEVLLDGVSQGVSSFEVIK